MGWIVSYLGGTLVMLFAALALGEPLQLNLLNRTHLLSWTGGIFGAIYIAVSILMLPKLGAALLIALIIAGQMFGSMIFDHFGLFGVPVHPVNAWRIAGAVLLLTGVVLIRL